ncbi:hypothetical protein BX600DRAFT_507429 [Xylariales sp. PMI_506]|nr:hypothetical protein BX600DRAFT_507429 [Xylariales sp. PMI_506]
MTGLSHLPHEIISSIAFELGSVDFFSLRLAGKQLRNATLFLFGQRYFAIRNVMLQRDSLENLSQIADHEFFAPAVHQLRIGIDHLLENPEDQNRWDGVNVQRFFNVEKKKSGIEKSVHDALFADQQSMVNSDLDTRILAQILSRLPNLDYISLDDRWMPWGALTLYHKSGLLPTNTLLKPESVDFITRYIRVIFTAIIESGTTLREIGIDVGLGHEPISAEMLVFPALYLPHATASSLRGATELSLTLQPESRNNDMDWNACFSSFINLFPDLWRLELQFLPYDEFLRFPSIARSLTLPKLKSLWLDRLECTEEDLQTMFFRHRHTLEDINLSTVHIDEGGSWRSLLRNAAETLPLKTLYIEHCRLAGADIGLLVEHKEDREEAIFQPTFKIEGDREILLAACDHVVVQSCDRDGYYVYSS